MSETTVPASLFTVTGIVEAELEEKNSRFFSLLVPYDQMDAQLARMQGQHPKAGHHVTAWRCFDDHWRILEKGRDDGEPGGTAGMPALRVLQGAELIQVGVIVTRYFGGIKLGTGGLARAYGGAAKLAVEQARETGCIIPFVRQGVLTLTADFSESGALEQLCNQPDIAITERGFTEQGVTLSLSGPEDRLSDLQNAWDNRNYR
ncbi:IMPACT family protein [Rhodovibrionaceae bacterium A322]